MLRETGQLLPFDTINALRFNYNYIIDVHGFPCELYIPGDTSVEDVEVDDIYEDYSNIVTTDYEKYDVKTFVEWSPNNKRLRKLGVYVENETPIVAWLDIRTLEVEIQKNSYIKLAINYIPNTWRTQEFELVERVQKAMYNSEVINGWIIAPKRYDTPTS